MNASAQPTHADNDGAPTVGSPPPQRVAQAYLPVLRWVLGASAAYYGFIAVSHTMVETGWTRAVLMSMASAGVVVPLLMWRRLRRPPCPSLGRLEVLAALAYTVFFLNVVVHEVVHFDCERLVYFVFMAMIFGITAPTLRVAYGAIAASLAAMALLGLRWAPDFLQTHVFVGVAGGFVSVGMASIVRGMVHREIRARALSEDLLLEARSSARARSAFLETISHELRTPLNGVLGMAQAIHREVLPASEARRLDILQREGEVLSRLLDDILDIVSLQAGRVELRPAPFRLEVFAQGLARLYAPAAAEKGVRFAVDVRDESAGLVVADETRLRQVAANLIANAIKFTAAGGSVEVSLTAGHERLALRVDDTGVGIPLDLQERIFEPFAQADDSITRDAAGAGLGLAICRQLVELMGGAIELWSEPGCGTSVTTTSPITRVAEEAAAHEAATFGARRVLVVDDNATNRLVLQTLLEGFGLDCQVAETGLEAVAACSAARWDLVLMDIHMPQMDGMTATREIRAREICADRPRTPIVAVTASVLPEDLARYAAAGMDGVIAKPVSIEVLAAALHRALGEAEDEGEADDGFAQEAVGLFHGAGDGEAATGIASARSA